MEFNPNWSSEKKGEWGENVVMELLRQFGWFVGNENDGMEKAPMFESDGDALIKPDIRAFKKQKDLWVEVKTKNDYITYGQAGNEKRHGIDKTNWEHYERVEQNNSTPLWVFIIEAGNDMLCYQMVSKLSVAQTLAKEDSNGAYEKDMVFFKREAFYRQKFAVKTNGVRFGQERLDSYSKQSSEFEFLFDSVKDNDGYSNRNITDYSD